MHDPQIYCFQLLPSAEWADAFAGVVETPERGASFAEAWHALPVFHSLSVAVAFYDSRLHSILSLVVRRVAVFDCSVP